MNPTLLVAAIGVALGGYVGYHRIHAGHQQQVQVIASQITQETADQEAQRKVAALFADLEAYQQRLPQEPDLSWLIAKITEAARTDGIELTSLSPDNPSAQKNFVRLSTKFQFLGTYHQVGRFLAQLESSRPFIRVDRVEMAPYAPPGGRRPARIEPQDEDEETLAAGAVPHAAQQLLNVRMQVSTLYVPAPAEKAPRK